MKNYEFTGTINGQKLSLKRIHKIRAKRLHKWKNERIFIQSSNLLPFNVWKNAIEIDKELDFDSFVTAFEYYNCNTKEEGYRSSFYIATSNN